MEKAIIILGIAWHEGVNYSFKSCSASGLEKTQTYEFNYEFRKKPYTNFQYVYLVAGIEISSLFKDGKKMLCIGPSRIVFFDGFPGYLFQQACSRKQASNMVDEGIFPNVDYFFKIDHKARKKPKIQTNSIPKVTV